MKINNKIKTKNQYKNEIKRKDMTDANVLSLDATPKFRAIWQEALDQMVEYVEDAVICYLLL